MAKKKSSATRPRTPAIKKAPAKKTQEVHANRAQQSMIHVREQFLLNVIRSRSELIQSLLDTRRDIYSECHYPAVGELTINHYKQMYEREAIAARSVQVLPEECWMVSPNITDSESETDDDTPFEIALDELSNSLRGESWHRSDEGNLIWSYLKRLDILSGLGSYGVMLIGIDDGLELSQPVEATPNNSPKHKLKYLRCFDESQVRIIGFNKDKQSSRFGYPEFYSITAQEETLSDRTGASQDMNLSIVHWSRAIHVADNLGSSESFGVPRMRPFYNRLHDLLKTYGGSAEMYWKGAFPGYSIESHPELGPDIEFDKAAIISEMDAMQNSLQRTSMITGASVKSIAPQVVDPTAHINIAIEAICIQLGCPIRVFKGSERGELASSQDDSSWNDTLRKRHLTHLTPNIVIQFVDRLIQLNVLPIPKNGYSVKWPDLNTLDEQSRAEILLKRTQAIAAFYQSGVEVLLDLESYLVKEFGYQKEEAAAITKQAEANMKEIIAEEERQAKMLADGEKADAKAKEKEASRKAKKSAKS